MFTSSQWRTIKPLERDVGYKFELTSPPVVEEVLEPSAEQVVAILNGVYPEYVEFFTPTAQKLILKKKKKKKKNGGLQICPSLVEFTSVRNMNTKVKRKCE